MRNWNIDNINNSDLADDIKAILEQEYYGKTLTEDDPHNFSSRNLSFADFKKTYISYFIALHKLLGIYYDYTDDLYKRYSYDEIGRYKFAECDITDEELVSYALDFYEALGDKEIFEIMQKLLDEKNGFVRIQPFDRNNPICREVRGRCFKPKNNHHIYASYYMEGTSEDLPIFVHETAHMFSHALFGSEINPIVKTILSETESYLFELLMNAYIANTLDGKELALYLDASRTSKVVNNIWAIRIQQILYRQIGRKPNMARLNRRLRKDGFVSSYTDNDFSYLTCYNLYELSYVIHSYLVALHFYRKIAEDREKGIYDFKQFMTSKQSNIHDLYDENNIDYEELLGVMDYVYERAVTLRKKKN